MNIAPKQVLSTEESTRRLRDMWGGEATWQLSRSQDKLKHQVIKLWRKLQQSHMRAAQNIPAEALMTATSVENADQCSRHSHAAHLHAAKALSPPVILYATRAEALMTASSVSLNSRCGTA